MIEVTNIRNYPAYPIIFTDGVFKLIESFGSAEPNKDGGKTSSELYNCIWINPAGEYSIPLSGSPYGMMLSGYKPYLPMVISPAEKIMVDDWWINLITGKYQQASKYDVDTIGMQAKGFQNSCKKILALPTELSARYFYENKIRENDKVEVECEEIGQKESLPPIPIYGVKVIKGKASIFKHLPMSLQSVDQPVLEIGIGLSTVGNKPLLSNKNPVLETDDKKVHSIQFLMWVTRNYPDAIIKHMDDEDGGEWAFESLYETFTLDRNTY